MQNKAWDGNGVNVYLGRQRVRCSNNLDKAYLDSQVLVKLKTDHLFRLKKVCMKCNEILLFFQSETPPPWHWHHAFKWWDLLGLLSLFWNVLSYSGSANHRDCSISLHSSGRGRFQNIVHPQKCKHPTSPMWCCDWRAKGNSLPPTCPEGLRTNKEDFEFNVRTVMRPHKTLKQRLVHPKDAIPDMEKSGVIYCIPCAECSATYEKPRGSCARGWMNTREHWEWQISMCQR